MGEVPLSSLDSGWGRQPEINAYGRDLTTKMDAMCVRGVTCLTGVPRS